MKTAMTPCMLTQETEAVGEAKEEAEEDLEAEEEVLKEENKEAKEAKVKTSQDLPASIAMERDTRLQPAQAQRSPKETNETTRMKMGTGRWLQ